MYRFSVKDGDREVVNSINTVECTDIVQEFFFFLQGASFHKETILNAMESVLQEHQLEMNKEEG